MGMLDWLSFKRHGEGAAIMGRKFTMDFQGKPTQVEEMEFEITKEEWNEYRLLDGGKVRAKLTVQRILWVLDSSGKRTMTPEGDPNFIVRSSTLVVGIERDRQP